MPAFGPIRRHDLIRCLRVLGFEGPYAGGKHQFMLREQLRLRIPNQHGSDIGPELLKRILAQAQIAMEEWERI